MEPAVTKTVSKDKVSALVLKLALILVMKESFLHEKKISAETTAMNMGFKLMIG